MIKHLQNIYSGPLSGSPGLPNGAVLLDPNSGFYIKEGNIVRSLTSEPSVRLSNDSPEGTEPYYENLWIGRDSGVNQSGTYASVGIGAYSLNNLITGVENVAVGTETLFTITTETFNTALGSAALYSIKGSRNTAVGRQAGVWVTTGGNNTFIGSTAGFAKVSGGSLTEINNSVLIGSYADGTQGSTNEIAIGFSVEGKGSNTATLGNTGITKTYLRGTINAAGLPTFADDAAAASLNTGDMYKTATGEVRWKL